MKPGKQLLTKSLYLSANSQELIMHPFPSSSYRFPVCWILGCALVLGFCSAASGQEAGFIPQRGQWEGDFDFRLQRDGQALFLRSNEMAYVLTDFSTSAHSADSPHKLPEKIKGHRYKVKLVGARSDIKPLPTDPLPGTINYLLGNDRQKWATQLRRYRRVVYPQVYPGIDLHFMTSRRGFVKYEFHLQPGADPGLIKLEYSGVQGMKIMRKKLAVETTVETVLENPPRSYLQGKKGSRKVACRYLLKDSLVSFAVEAPGKENKLIIDPTLVFSTYSGSTTDNWGFTATHAKDGGAYAAGVAFTPRGTSEYPTSVGAFQDTFGGGIVDVAISRYDSNGSNLIYATYLGGFGNEVPFSILELKEQQLLLLGNTGSPDFPMHSAAYDSSLAMGSPGALGNFQNFSTSFGSELYLAILDSTGSNLEASTFLGDTGMNGGNARMVFNYGDNFRGDLAADSAGNIYFTANDRSGGLPLSGPGAQNSFGGDQDGYVASLNATLSQLRWATYLGGSLADAIFSLVLDEGRDKLHLAGATESTAWRPSTASASYRDSLSGKVDGFLATVKASSGALEHFTFTGTPEDDLCYFTDIGHRGQVYAFGQTYGNFPVSDTAFYSNPGSGQFVQEFSSDLSQSIRSTTFGSSDQGFTNISPTAMMVDDCDNIYVAGFMSQGFNRGNPASQSMNGQLPLKRPYQSSTDGQDFYFLVLDASWQRLNFASYFGDDKSFDHVDGGTSRFRSDGTIYQGVCAGCGGSNTYPTTPKAYSRTNNSPNCNMAVTRFDMEANQVKAEVSVSSNRSDSACVPFQRWLSNESINADIVVAVYPNGRRDTLQDSLRINIVDTGQTRLRFFALDTNCQLIDSTSLEFYGREASLQAQFETNYDSCRGNNAVQFSSSSGPVTHYLWVFGDGDTSRTAQPSHQYARGNYQVTLIVRDSVCGQEDSLQKQLNINSRQYREALTFDPRPCDREDTLALKLAQEGYQSVRYSLNGQLIAVNKDSLKLTQLPPGMNRLKIDLQDSLCGRSKTLRRSWYILPEDFELRFPNVFTPNDDGRNDTFGPLASPAPESLPYYQLQVYDRKGRRVYATTDPEERWNGRYEGGQAVAAVYFYVVNYRDICDRPSRHEGFVHLLR